MDELSQARTKKKEFLEQMDGLIPWEKWVEEIRPCYYKGECGNKPYGIELMLLLKKGTIVDSTLISAPSSTKNAEKKRDPEAHSTKKGNTWHFGYKGTHRGG